MKIEKFLNNMLFAIMEKVGPLFQKMIPKKINTTVQNSRTRLNTTKSSLQSKIKTIKDNSLGKISKATQKTVGVKNKVKEKTVNIITHAKNIDYKSLNYVEVLGSFMLLTLVPFTKLKAWLITLNPKFLIGLTMGSMLTGLVSINIYTNSKDIVEKSAHAARVPLSEVEDATAPSKRPGYYKQNERELRIRNMTMPVYIGSSKDLHSLTIDFTIISSNKYIKEYFLINTYRVRDKMFSSIEPILPDFPLKTEGKKIIKEKLIRELKIMLNDMSIKGSIKEIHIHSILAG